MDITEIDCDGLKAAGMTVEQIVRQPRFPKTGVIAGILSSTRQLTIPRGDAVIPGLARPGEADRPAR